MKKIFLLLCIVASTTVTAQNKDYIISMEGIGAIKLNMKQAELEKLLKKKIPLTNPMDTVSGSWQDSAKIRYKNIDIELRFQRGYVTNDSFYMFITWIGTSSPLCKTITGIGIGSDKLKIISAYDGYYLSIQPSYLFSNKEEEIPERSKTMSMKSERRMWLFNCFNL